MIHLVVDETAWCGMSCLCHGSTFETLSDSGPAIINHRFRSRRKYPGPVKYSQDRVKAPCSFAASSLRRSLRECKNTRVIWSEQRMGRIGPGGGISSAASSRMATEAFDVNVPATRLQVATRSIAFASVVTSSHRCTACLSYSAGIVHESQ